jgi:hypothetical protein
MAAGGFNDSTVSVIHSHAQWETVDPFATLAFSHVVYAASMAGRKRSRNSVRWLSKYATAISVRTPVTASMSGRPIHSRKLSRKHSRRKLLGKLSASPLNLSSTPSAIFSIDSDPPVSLLCGSALFAFFISLGLVCDQYFDFE